MFCGELSIAQGQYGYAEATQVFLAYHINPTLSTPRPGDIPYKDVLLDPMLEPFVSVDRPSASIFMSEYGALKMATTTEVCCQVVDKLIDRDIPPTADLELRLMRLSYQKMGTTGVRKVPHSS